MSILTYLWRSTHFYNMPLYTTNSTIYLSTYVPVHVTTGIWLSTKVPGSYPEYQTAVTTAPGIKLVSVQQIPALGMYPVARPNALVR